MSNRVRWAWSIGITLGLCGGLTFLLWLGDKHPAVLAAVGVAVALAFISAVLRFMFFGEEEDDGGW